MKTAYVSHNFEAGKFIVDNVVMKLHAHGIMVNSRWLYQSEGKKDGLACALMDTQDVASADMLILFTDDFQEGKPGLGKWVELGMAIARGESHDIYLIGEKLNRSVFFAMIPDANKFKTLDEFLGAWRSKDGQ